MELYELPATDVDDKSPPSSEDEQGVAHDAAAPDSGVRKIEAIQQVWGSRGKYFLWAGLAMMMIIFELDNATLYSYQPYATSAFHKQALLAALQTMQAVVTAAAKPPFAKISDVIGRAETYCICVTFYVISYIICASAKSMNVYAGGMVFYSLGQTGTQVLDQILLSDISSQRWRGFVLAFSYFPFLITPWVSASIVESVVTGIGWRWGYGMFAILMPFCASFIIIPLFVFQSRAKRKGIIQTRRLSVVAFLHEVDLLGTLLLCGGAAMILIPISLASTLPQTWKNPRIDALLAIGGACLIAFPFYERYARYPIVPMFFLKNVTIMLSCLLSLLDGFGFSCTHAYLYSFVVVTRGWDARHATYLVYVNGVVQCLVGIFAGWIMYKTRRYKHLIFIACVIRTIGYGVMLRLRGASNPTWELYIVQAIQGLGSGVITSAAVVSAQVSVAHRFLASISAFFLLCSFIGSSVGSAVAGAIYTNRFRGFLRAHLPGASDAAIESVFDSITGTLPPIGSPERDGINDAYGDVLRVITWAALGVSFVMPLLALFLKNGWLGDGHNEVEQDVLMANRDEGAARDEGKVPA